MTTHHTAGAAGTVQTDEYRPLLPPEGVERIRELRQTLLAGQSDDAGEETVSFLHLTLKVPAEVMTPCPVSPLFGQAIVAELDEGDRMLDMGTGSGSLSVLAAGKAAHVLAVDLNPHAVQAARANAALNGVADRVEVRQSDVFANVDGTFDLIVFNPPFQWFAARDVADAATQDENYGALTRFFREVREHLTDKGRVMVFFSTMGDVNYLHKLIADAGFQREDVLQHSAPVAGTQVEFFAYCLR